jgi:hypothetical protein
LEIALFYRILILNHLKRDTSADATSPLSSAEQLRYARQLSLPEIGLSGQHQLRRASVLVIGAGGLGTPALLYLAAAGDHRRLRSV